MRVKRGAQIHREDGVPLLRWKLVNRSDVLDASVVHEDVNATENLRRLRDHRLDLRWALHVCTRVDYPHTVLLFQVRANALDLVRVPEAVEHHIGACARQRSRDAETDAAGGTSDDG